MFGKIIFIIVGFGAIGSVLLVNRQSQIDIAHEMSRIHERVAAHERTIWRLRAEIARQCSPDELRRARERLDAQWMPFVRDHHPSRPGAARFDTRHVDHDSAEALEEDRTTEGLGG
jgi:hypothetical protein